jgi:aspartate aminotransferase
LGDELLVDRRSEYRRRRDLADELLRGFGLNWIGPKGAFYGLVSLNPGDAPDGLAFATRLLEEYGVAVAPGSAFGAATVGTVRLSLAAADDDLRTGIESLAKADEEAE